MCSEARLVGTSFTNSGTLLGHTEILMASEAVWEAFEAQLARAVRRKMVWGA